MPLENTSDGVRSIPAHEKPSRISCMPWELVENELPQGGDVPASESLFTLANGHICVRGYTEESETAMLYSKVPDTHESPPLNLTASSRKGHASSRSLSESHAISSPVCFAACGSTCHKGRSAISKKWQPPERSVRGTYVNGFCEERLLTHRQHQRSFTVGICARDSFFIRAPDAFCIDVFVGGEHVTAETGNILSHRRVFNYRAGELRRHLVWQSKRHGHQVAIESSRIVSLTRKGIAALKYRVSAKNVSNTNIRVVSRTIVPPDARQHCRIESIVAGHTLHDAFTSVFVRTRNSCKRLVVAESEACSSSQYDHTAVSNSNAFSVAGSMGVPAGAEPPLNSLEVGDPLMVSRAPKGPLDMTTQKKVQPKSACTFLAPKTTETENGAETTYTSVIRESTYLELTKYIAFLVDEDAAPEDISDVGIQHAREAANLTYGSLYFEQVDYLSNFWERANVHIKSSDTSLEGAIRFNMLHLIMTSRNPQPCHSPSRGFMSDLYGGIHRWDVDVIIIPFFSHVHPEVARGLLQFRIDTLPQARSLAADVDFPRGALYPQRTVNGTESKPPPFCAAFLFTNAVIAYAMKHYITATGNYSILIEGGADVLFSTALIWLIWGTWDKGGFHLRSVGGPDDYSSLGDNNHFTNVMARFHMQWAVQMAAFIQEEYPGNWEAIKERCQLSDEDLVMMSEAAAKIVVVFDAKNRVYPVDQLFMRRKKWMFGDLKKKKSLLFRTFDPSVVYRHQVCRLPEVMLASLLLQDLCTKDEVKANYNFYEPITTCDCSLASMIFCIVAVHTDKLDKGMHYFHRNLFNDVKNLLGNTGRGVHSSSAAGSWWCLTIGFGGMRVVDDELRFDPVLPDAWEEYHFFVRHHGYLIKVFVTRRMVTYTAIDGFCGMPDLLIHHTDAKCIHLRSDSSESVRLYRDVRVFDFDCVVFDLDSIIEDLEGHQYCAWKKTLEKYLHERGMTSFVFTDELYLAYFENGNSFTSLEKFLAKNGITGIPHGNQEDTVEKNTIFGLLQRKRHNFRSLIHDIGLTVHKGALQLMKELRQNDISIGCATDSKSGQWMLRQVPQVMCLIDRCMDGNDGEVLSLCWRPEMNYFSTLCRQLNTTTGRTIVVMRRLEGFSKSALEQFRLVVHVQYGIESLGESACNATHPANVRNMDIPTLAILDECASVKKLVTTPPYSHERHRTQTSKDPASTIR